MRIRLVDVLLVSAVFLLVFFALFLGRTADDNSLFSWAWAFATIDAARIYVYLVAGLVLSSFLSSAPILEAYHIPFLAMLSFAACLPFWTESELIVDASRYFTQAKHLELYGVGFFVREWGKTIPAWTDLPLAPFLYGLIFKLFGEHRTVVQLFTTALFSLTTVLTYSIGRKLWNRQTAFSAGLLLLGIPYLLTQVPLMLVDVLAMFCLTLSLSTFLDAMNKGGAARIALSAAAIVLTVLSKYSAWFMLSVLGVALVVYALQRSSANDRGPWVRGVSVLALAAAASAAVLLYKFDVVSGQLRLLAGYQHAGLKRWGESFVSTFLFQVHPIVTLSALASLGVAVRKRDPRLAIVGWLVLLVALFNIRRIRYILPVFPMVALMAGYGLQVIRREELRRLVLFGVAASSLVIGIFVYVPFAGRMSAANLKQAGAYLDTLDADVVEAVTIPPREPVANPAVAVPLLDLFTTKRIRYRYRPEGFPAPEEIERSSLRFTWEYRNPDYYEHEPEPPGKTPIVVISDASDDPLPKDIGQRLEGCRLSKFFHLNEGIFQYSVGARVYQCSAPAPSLK